MLSITPYCVPLSPLPTRALRARATFPVKGKEAVHLCSYRHPGAGRDDDATALC